ncbi:hypothetical protein BAE44_0009776 [Dichanthelium oligosanthes]|uniref:Uncharacterized protein n=1 Tax=Dichanthelium oligosanthes TaxID=888268 RepID=A0A1E5VVN6_9POAL|nr:hypothetical protein BAE44_0009776 [Dichanthelium oligosanthes]
MARATAPSRRPPSAVAAVAASSPPAAAAPARVPQRRASLAFAARGALSHPKGGPSAARLAAPAPAPPRRRAPASYACSPTTHPGSFRCALHRGPQAPAPPASALLVSSRLSAPRRASMANPLVRIAAVEGGDQIRRALASLVRPPPASQHRRRAHTFRPRPSRLSSMSSTAQSP